MCGIFGVYRFDGRQVEAEILERACMALASRGPDGKGIWRHGHVGFAHTLLAIRELPSAGAQPMTGRAAGVITYNGELYNSDELRKAFASTEPWSGRSDTEVLVRTLERWGADALPKLEGMYAFAYYRRSEDFLLLARDRFGIKPLYYHVDANRIIFASEIRGLFLDPATPRRANLNALREHVMFGHSFGGETAFEGIRRLEAGHQLVVRRGRLERSRAHFALEALAGGSPPDIGSLLTRSASDHCQSQVPIGISLSGGLDSNLLMAEVPRTQRGDGRMVAFNVGSNRGGDLDRQGAIMCARHYEIPLIKVDEVDPATVDLGRLAEELEEPIANSAALDIKLVAEAARASGAPVLFFGHGGDELFAGYRRHVIARHWAMFQAPFLRWAVVAGSSVAGVHYARRLASIMVTPLRDQVAALPAMGLDSMVQGLGVRGLAERGWLSAFDQAESFLAAHAALSPLKRIQLLDLHGYLANHNLVVLDKMCMLSGVEGRVPYLDSRLAAAGLALGDDELVSNATTKRPLRRLAARTLPRELLSYPKLGFGSPLRAVISNPSNVEKLTRKGSFTREWIGPEVIEILRSGAARGLSHDENQLFSLMLIESWREKYRL